MTNIPLHLHLPFKFIIRRCPFREYKKLAQFHYRAGNPGPVDKCFGLYHLSDEPSSPNHKSEIKDQRSVSRSRLIGIIVYSMPPLNNQLRNLATNHRYSAIPAIKTRAQMINREIRTISRVIIHPQFRSLGLATELVKRTLPLAKTLFVEASAVMGLINPFFTKAGMKMFTAPNDLKRETLLAAFQYINVTPEELLDTNRVVETINRLNKADKTFIHRQIEKYFLQPRRATFSSNVPNDLNWIIPRLAHAILQRPAYFIWQNPQSAIRNPQSSIQNRKS